MGRILIPESRIVLILFTLITVFSCGNGSVLERVEEEYENGNYREAIFLVRHHLHEGGSRDPRLLFIAAESMMELGIEGEAADYFAEIYGADSSWASKIAEVLRNKAFHCLEEGAEGRGRRYMIQAAGYDPGLSFAEYDLEVGKALLEGNDCRGAIKYLQDYLSSYSDSAGAAEAALNLAAAYQRCGAPLKAIDTYKALIVKYPLSRFVSTARWNYENLSIEEAEEMIEGGESAEARSLLEQLVNSRSSTLIRVQAYFMLGEIYSEQGLIDKALECYRMILRLNLGSSGRFAEKAKERIEELE